ncbi:FecCD family ABC transporter permease [Salinicola aestuarinus]|uniref:FecCD family ABC transporter permease n=1 Tax=Salinicola aestuarinus TaxID=1949082 RepID=UPI000DA146EF|nr:iron ABC transporter permease [Salinicola aestuarinus]
MTSRSIAYATSPRTAPGINAAVTPPTASPADSPAPAAKAPTGTRQLTWRFRGHRGAVLFDRRGVVTNLGLALALALVAIASLCLGSLAISPLAALQGLAGFGDPMNVFVVRELRLSRLMAGLATGAAFALSGCLMQTLARNRLATPGIIGIDNGATAFAVASVLGVGVGLAPPPMALAGAVTATVITFALASDIGTRGYRFLVAGIGVGAIFGALTQLLLAQVAIDAANAAYPWTVGSLNARDAASLTWLEIGLGLGLIAALWFKRDLACLRFADSVATGLGVRVKRSRFAALAVSIALTGLAVAVAGPVGMVSLMGPEIARQLSSPRGVPLFGAALSGALVMVSADLVGRLLVAPIEIPVGIVTAIVGAPFLLWILLRPAARFRR